MESDNPTSKYSELMVIYNDLERLQLLIGEIQQKLAVTRGKTGQIHIVVDLFNEFDVVQKDIERNKQKLDKLIHSE